MLQSFRVALVTGALLIMSLANAQAQNMYEGDTLAFGAARYSANLDYRIRFNCVSSTCSVVQDVWNGSAYVPRGYIFNNLGAYFSRLEMYFGNLIWYTNTNSIVNWSFTYSAGQTNYLNIQDDGNVVIYDGNHQAIWTPTCQLPSQVALYPFDVNNCP